MKTLFASLKKLGNQFLGLFPTAIPTGTAEFDAWAQFIMDNYKMPTADVDSIKYALATMVMHLGPTVAYKPRYYFALALRASAAKQVAGGVFMEIKTRHQAAAAKASEPKSEATTLKAVASLEPVQK